MSTASKITLLATSVGTLAIIWTVHNRQVEDRAQLHQGIVRDIERQEKKKIENQHKLVQQQELTKLYKHAEARDSETKPGTDTSTANVI